jgi:hypothetical protein
VRAIVDWLLGSKAAATAAPTTRRPQLRRQCGRCTDAANSIRRGAAAGVTNHANRIQQSGGRFDIELGDVAAKFLAPHLVALATGSVDIGECRGRLWRCTGGGVRAMPSVYIEDLSCVATKGAGQRRRAAY